MAEQRVDSFARRGDSIAAQSLGDDRFRISCRFGLRLPNVEASSPTLGLEVGRGGITVDDRQRTNVGGVWAAGDVAAGPMLTPIAQYQARIAVEDMFADGSRRADYSALPTAIFTDPELGGVGLTETEAAAQGHDVGVVKHPLPFVTRAQITGAKHGSLQIVFDRKTRRVLASRRIPRGKRHRRQHHPALKLGVTVAT